MPILDQRTDRSGSYLVKLAAQLVDQKLAGELVDSFFHMDRPVTGEAFPVSSAEDVRFSRLYFEGQREKIAADEAEKIDNKLSVYEALYGVSSNYEFKPKMAKVAAQTVSLLPSVKVASVAELNQAGTDFSNGLNDLSFEDRVTFSQNFTKCAWCNEVSIPEDVCLYAGYNVEQNEHLEEYLRLRKVACDRAGKDGSSYEKLADLLSGKTLEDDDLMKLACAVYEADKKNGLTQRKYDKKLPDAWHSVFQCKQAEEQEAEDGEHPEDLSKADIIARFGDGAIDAVQNDEGEIDKKRLAQVMRLFQTNVEKA